jgi:hypothetical protein
MWGSLCRPSRPIHSGLSINFMALTMIDSAFSSSKLWSYIRSSIMSHITFIMCQFVLIVHLRDFHFDFDLDIVVLWSCYGVLRLTYTTYQNLCATHHFFGQLLMSQDTSPTWIVLLESIYWIIQVLVCIFPMFQDGIMSRFPMSVSDLFKFPQLPIFLSDVHIPTIRIFSCFSSFRQVHLHLSPNANWCQ